MSSRPWPTTARSAPGPTACTSCGLTVPAAPGRPRPSSPKGSDARAIAPIGGSAHSPLQTGNGLRGRSAIARVRPILKGRIRAGGWSAPLKELWARMRQQGTLASAIVVVLLSGIVSATAMTGSFSPAKPAAPAADAALGAADTAATAAGTAAGLGGTHPKGSNPKGSATPGQAGSGGSAGGAGGVGGVGGSIAGQTGSDSASAPSTIAGQLSGTVSGLTPGSTVTSSTGPAAPGSGSAGSGSGPAGPSFSASTLAVPVLGDLLKKVPVGSIADISKLLNSL